MADENFSLPQHRFRGYTQQPEGYALSGKIMLSAIIILFTVIFLIICFHIYARCFLIRNRPPHNHRRHRRRRRRTHRTHFIFTTNPPSNDTVFVVSRGLDASTLKSIPTFVYSSTTHDELLECAVCLSEFEENEKGRILPKCNHSFHTECIDMWFHSHSTCPICRSPVNPEISEAAGLEIPIQIVIDSADLEPRTSSIVPPCASCRNEGVEIGSLPESGSGSSSASGVGSSSSSLLPLTIEVRKLDGSFKGLEGEEIQVSPESQGLRSPGSRMQSLKRILSREKKGSMTSSLSFCESVAEIDPEKGGEEEGSVHPPK